MQSVIIFLAVLLSIQAVALPAAPLGKGKGPDKSNDVLTVYVDEKGNILGNSDDKGALNVKVDLENGVYVNVEAGNNDNCEPDYSRIPYGISYSAYNDDSTCRTQEQVNHDLDIVKNYAYVRIYGTDCDQTQKVVTAARQRKMQVFAGIYDLKDFPASLDAIITAANGDWSVFHTINVGNELVNRGQASAADVAAAVNTARTKLRAAGYTGPVVTVDTFNQVIAHPELCTASDYCAANCHAFFDATRQAADAGKYARDQAQQISKAAGGKRTVITESGWPKQGRANGKAVPSVENHNAAIQSLKDAFKDNPGDLVLFSAFDDKWKQDNGGTFEAEKFWGIYER